MAARQTFVSVSAEYLETIIVQGCEFDEAALGSAIPRYTYFSFQHVKESQGSCLVNY